MLKDQITIFNDGKCLVCSFIVKLLNLIDRKDQLIFIDLWTIKKYSQFQKFSVNHLASQIHLIDEKGKIYKGYFVFKYLVEQLPTLVFLRPIFRISGIDKIGIKTYKLIARNRIICTGYCQ